MFSANGTISARQMGRLLLFDVFGMTSLLLPAVAIREAGRDAMVVVLLGSILAVTYVCFFICFGAQAETDYFTYMEKGVGTVFGKIFLVLYFGKLLFSLVFILSYFADLLEHTLLTGTNYLIIVGAILLVGGYISFKGIEERGRTAEFLTYLIFVPIVFFLFIGLKKVDAANVLPVLTGTGGAGLSGTYAVLLTYSAVELLLFMTPLCKSQKKKTNNRIKSVMGSFLTVSVFVVFFCFLTIGILGQKETGDKLWSSVTVMQIVELPGGLVRRQDAFFLSLWIMTVLLLVGSLIYYLRRLSAKIVGVKKEKQLILPICLIVFAFVCVGYRLETVFSWYGEYMKYIGFPQSILMPLLIYCAHKLQGGRKSEEK